MGCGFSRPDGPNAPNPGTPAPSPASRVAPPSNDGQATEQSQPRTRIRSQQPLSRHIDRTLRRHNWNSLFRSWTRQELDHERAEFFDTRVTGRADVWQVIRAALQILWEADLKAQDAQDAAPPDSHSSALTTAQGILRAAEITLPTGDLANGVYDAQGNYYPLPEWVVCDPENIAKGPLTTVESPGPEDPYTESAADVHEQLKRHREAKGKATVPTKPTMKIRIRLSDTGRDVVVRVAPGETIRQISVKVREMATIPKNNLIRLAYLGKILKEDESLEDQGWQRGHVMSAFVSIH